MQEISPSPGYLLDETVHEVGASPSLYEIELNTTENTLSETVIRGNIQPVKHTDDPDPDVSDRNTATMPMPVWWKSRRKALFLRSI